MRLSKKLREKSIYVDSKVSTLATFTCLLFIIISIYLTFLLCTLFALPSIGKEQSSGQSGAWEPPSTTSQHFFGAKAPSIGQ
jgi:hypothetical protein